MKSVIVAFFMCWGMFLSVPCPVRRWHDELRPLSTAFLPLIGGVMGLIWALCAFLIGLLDGKSMFWAAVLTLLPHFLTGGIHLDGFMDCCDAIFSRRDLETKLRILKDSTVGAFAVIGLCALLLTEFALFAGGDGPDRFPGLVFIPMVTRACAGAAVLIIPPLGHSSYSGSFAQNAKNSHVAILAAALVIAAVAPLVLMGAFGGGLCGAAALIGSCAAVAYGVKQLGGMSGDIAGFSIVIGELAGLIVLLLV